MLYIPQRALTEYKPVLHVTVMTKKRKKKKNI